MQNTVVQISNTVLTVTSVTNVWITTKMMYRVVVPYTESRNTIN